MKAPAPDDLCAGCRHNYDYHFRTYGGKAGCYALTSSPEDREMEHACPCDGYKVYYDPLVEGADDSPLED